MFSTCLIIKQWIFNNNYYTASLTSVLCCVRTNTVQQVKYIQRTRASVMNYWIMYYVECCAFVLLQCLSHKARHPDKTQLLWALVTIITLVASGNAGHWGCVGKKALKFVRPWRFILNVVSHCCELWHFSSLTLQGGTSEGKRNRARPQKNVRFTITITGE